MNIFIDFGPGAKPHHAKKYKELGYHTIGIDAYMNHSEEHFDEFVKDFWHTADVPKADAWACTNALEHVPEDMLDETLAGMAARVQGPGLLVIDLKDHKFGKPGTDMAHWEYREYRSDPTESTYLNRLTVEEWLDKLADHFIWDVEETDKNQYGETYVIWLENVYAYT